MIEEFTDVNEGEKSLMKLWNLHMLKKGYVLFFWTFQIKSLRKEKQDKLTQLWMPLCCQFQTPFYALASALSIAMDKAI